MVQVQRSLCDLCGSDQKVAIVTVMWEGNHLPWEADICASCYKDTFALLESKGRRAGRSNVRGQHKFQKIDETAFDL